MGLVFRFLSFIVILSPPFHTTTLKFLLASRCPVISWSFRGLQQIARRSNPSIFPPHLTSRFHLHFLTSRTAVPFSFPSLPLSLFPQNPEKSRRGAPSLVLPFLPLPLPTWLVKHQSNRALQHGSHAQDLESPMSKSRTME